MYIYLIYEFWFMPIVQIKWRFLYIHIFYIHLCIIILWLKLP